MFANDFAAAPDYVAFPDTEYDIILVMRFCEKENVGLIPVGGGSSVVGGIEPVVINNDGSWPPTTSSGHQKYR